MAISERSRSAIYQGLRVVIDDEQAIDEMLSYFPSRDAEEPVTKEFLRAELAELRADLNACSNRYIAWLITTQVALAGVVIAAASAFR